MFLSLTYYAQTRAPAWEVLPTMGSLQREGSEGEKRHRERKKRRDGESRQR